MAGQGGLDDGVGLGLITIGVLLGKNIDVRMLLHDPGEAFEVIFQTLVAGANREGEHVTFGLSVFLLDQADQFLGETPRPSFSYWLET